MAEIDVASHEVAGGAALGLLGSWRLTLGGRPVALPPATRRILALLALHGPLTRAAVSCTLWPEADEAAANCRLRTALWRLAGGRDLVGCQDGQLTLAPTVVVDVRRMRRTARALAAADPADLDERNACPARLFEEDLLPSWYDEWLVVERERIRQTRLHALESLSSLRLRQQRYAEAVDTALAAVRSEPLRESAHRAVILAHLAEGNVVEAIRQYGACRTVLREELGVEPSPALAELLPPQPRADRLALYSGGTPAVGCRR